MMRANSSPLSENAGSMPPFADIAQLIAGPNVPAWLAAHFKRGAPSLKLDRFVEDKQPTKSELKEQLRGIRDAALLLRCALSEAATREFLEINSQDRIEYGGASRLRPQLRNTQILACNLDCRHAARSANQRHAASSHVCDCLGIPQESGPWAAGIKAPRRGSGASFRPLLRSVDQSGTKLSTTFTKLV